MARIAAQTSLVVRDPNAYSLLVSTGELLEQVKALPSREREKFLLALLKVERKPSRRNQKNGRVEWPDVEARAKRIFGNRMLPNLVLLERQEEAVDNSVDCLPLPHTLAT